MVGVRPGGRECAARARPIALIPDAAPRRSAGIERHVVRAAAGKIPLDRAAFRDRHTRGTEARSGRGDNLRIVPVTVAIAVDRRSRIRVATHNSEDQRRSRNQSWYAHDQNLYTGTRVRNDFSANYRFPAVKDARNSAI